MSTTDSSDDGSYEERFVIVRIAIIHALHTKRATTTSVA